MRLHWRVLGLAALVAALMVGMGLSTAGVAAASPASFKVIASGLNNPRGLAFGHDGALYVAEAGKGGNQFCVNSPEGGQQCYGTTGSITRIAYGHQARIVTGLPSVAGSDGSQATGPVDVAPKTRGDVYAIIGGVAPDPAHPQLQRFGRLVHFNAWGKSYSIANLEAYEAKHNPDGQEINSNPNGLTYAGYGRFAVADAGANDVLLVGANGHISTLAVFPARQVTMANGQKVTVESVPTTVVRGPDGAYYVGELTGAPFVPGVARVYRIVPGHKPTVYAGGFTNIIDMAFGRDGKLYVLEIAKNGLASGDLTGALIKVDHHGKHTVASAGLVAPGGLAIGHDGYAYVSNYSIFAGQGQVVRIRL